MRLLFLNHNIARSGGTFHRAFAVARHLARRGHSVTLLTISPTRRFGFHKEIADGVELVHTPDFFWGIGRTGWDPWDTLNRIVFLCRRDWDIIHAWDSRPAVSLPALFARWKSRDSKLVMDWCDWWGRGGTQTERQNRWVRLVSPVETFFEEGFRGYADGSTVISQALYDRALNLGVSEATMRILPQGCELVESATKDRLRSRSTVGISPSDQLVVSVGALQRGDSELLFDSVRQLFRRRPQSWFALIGRHSAYVPDDLRSHPHFRETGFVSEQTLADYMAASDALLTVLADTLASRARWPSKVNPFMAAGRTIVITRVGDLPALLEHEQAGVVCDPAAGAIVEALCRTLDDAPLREKVGESARRLARTTLAWPAIVEQLETLYVMLSRVS